MPCPSRARHPGTASTALLLVLGGCASREAPDPSPLHSPTPGIAIERVLGPEAPGAYKHPSSFTELANGDLFLVYHAGRSEYSDDTAVYATRRSPGGSWSEPTIIADTPWRGEGNAVAWQAPDGLVWLFYVCRYGPTWSSSRIKAKVSSDGARSWSDSFLLDLEEGLMVRSRPIVVRDGSYLLPIYFETGEDTELVSPDCAALFLRLGPGSHEWRQSARIHHRLGCLQPAVAELDDGRLVAYCRRGGDYEGQSDGFVVRSESIDGGETWTPGADSAFPNPNAAVDFVRLTSGSLVLVYNDSHADRTPLSVAISRDGDASYPWRAVIAGGDGSYAYPTALQTSDGSVRVLFTSDERTVIRLATFREETIAGP